MLKCKHLAKQISKYPFTVKKNKYNIPVTQKDGGLSVTLSCPFDFHIFHTLNNFLSDFEFKKPIHKVLLF